MWRGLFSMSEERRWVSRWLLDRARSPWRSPGPKIQVLSCLLSHSLDENVERTAARCGARIAGTNLSPEGRPPSPRSSPQWGRGCTPVAWRCWPAQGHWRRSNPVRSRSRARARPWPKCPTCHSRHVAFVRAPHRLNGHGPCFYLGAGLVYVRHVWRTQYSGSHRFPSGTPIFYRVKFQDKLLLTVVEPFKAVAWGAVCPMAHAWRARL
jgi:hypothetical protein